MKTSGECPACRGRITLLNAVFSNFPTSLRCRRCGAVLHAPGAPKKAFAFVGGPLFGIVGIYGGWHCAAGHFAEVGIAVAAGVFLAAVVAVVGNLYVFNRCRFELKPPPTA